MEVTRASAQTLDGESAQIGNLIIHLSENTLSQITSLPRLGERWFKNKTIEEKA
jgi:hypothetical protein